MIIEIIPALYKRSLYIGGRIAVAGLRYKVESLAL